ncbi:MAG: DUF262 domain-containing protein [bacterium]|nr:DUF262 domain-containing protein [bacterium]
MARLKTLLDQIDSGELALPEIQRDFVWNKKNVLLLFDSLYRELPIGYMLVWKAKTAIADKPFKGWKKRKVGQAIESFYGYLLDGQQRLTAIRLVRDGDDNYPLMFSLKPDDEEKPDEDRFSYRTKWKLNNPWFVSVTDVITDQVRGHQLIEQLKENTNDFNPDTDADRIYASVSKLKSVLDYNIGVIEYEDNHYRKATELFIRFNSTGKKLKGTDLVAAELALVVPELISQGINNTGRKFSPQFSFSSPFLIQCLAAVHTGKMSIKKPKDVWSGSDDREIKQSWKRTERGLGRIIEFLTGTVKWDSVSWLPSINSIIPLVYLLSQNRFNVEERRMARKWLLSANIYAVFSGAVHSELDRILRGLKKDPSMQKLINLTRRDMGIIKPYFFETRRKSGPAMSLYISTLRNNNAKDWISRTPLDGSVIGHNAELQVHHFFPQKLLYDNGYNSEQINTFANYTVINKETNLDISSEEPINYIRKRKIKKKDLQEQSIPLDKSLWTVNRYEDFLNARRKLLAKNTNAFLS